MSTLDSTGVEVGNNNPWLETYLGVKFYPLNPSADAINIIDIAHALSMQCRYAGHVTRFYSVAEHSVRVSEIVSPANALWGLLHDAAEAYLQDMIRPLKCLSPLGDEYRKLEERVMEVIAEKYHLPSMPAEIKWADNTLGFTEKRDLRVKQLKWQDEDKYPPLREVIRPWSPDVAESRFLNRFWQLTGVGSDGNE